MFSRGRTIEYTDQYMTAVSVSILVGIVPPFQVLVNQFLVTIRPANTDQDILDILAWGSVPLPAKNLPGYGLHVRLGLTRGYKSWWC